MLSSDRLDHHFGIYSGQAVCLGNVGHQVGFGHLSSFVSASITDRFYTEDLKKDERQTRVRGEQKRG